MRYYEGDSAISKAFSDYKFTFYNYAKHDFGRHLRGSYNKGDRSCVHMFVP